MRSKQLVTGAPGTYVVVLDAGDRVLDELTRFARSSGIGTASVTAIGGLSSATLAYFDVDTKQYQDIPVDEQVEVLTMTGVLVGDDEPQMHLHAVLGRHDGTTRGGHLRAGLVRPTLEVMITESPPHLVRRHDPDSGLPLIDLDAWETGRSS
ncbi:PPC domain-containing DNA-binding protein [Haloactinomyces albus]|uniref:DNA-binding protein with PD1-like motif n=1 Tax=Haloactinomyces albus TaxID=1352928 RepID=A0AAE3ZJF1_9ACTN|nr:DNA-binding protein [Haloactinomyces albus]MDR7304282.1 putative DNA-binding protein with PD1-like motif [Haloactinomyces albus]